ncbi:hypothetical protein ACQPYK_44180 [Streptosporangium sp. CA-135522]
MLFEDDADSVDEPDVDAELAEPVELAELDEELVLELTVLVEEERLSVR